MCALGVQHSFPESAVLFICNKCIIRIHIYRVSKISILNILSLSLSLFLFLSPLLYYNPPLHAFTLTILPTPHPSLSLPTLAPSLSLSFTFKTLYETSEFVARLLVLYKTSSLLANIILCYFDTAHQITSF